jgi:2-methylcitrate dehydratase PrpD
MKIVTGADRSSHTLADSFGIWAAELSLESIPTAVIHQAKRCLIDVIGVAVAGTDTVVSRMARAHVDDQYAEGRCAVLAGTGGTVAAGAAFANAIAAHALDFDDTCYAGIVHGSAIVWPAVAAATEAAGGSGADLLSAFIVGVEVEYTLGKVLTDHLYERGCFNTSLLGAIGAAAGAAKAMRLDARQAGQAISLAACQASGVRAVLGTPAKPYLAGRAAETGVHAANFARSGLLAPADAFEEHRGFIKVLNDGVAEPAEIENLGRVYCLENPGIAFKLFPVCSAAQAAAEATTEILADENIDPDAVERVLCEVTPLVHISLTHDRPETVTQAQFSMPFAIGCMLAFGGLGVDRLSAATLADSHLRRCMAKVEMVLSPDLAENPEVPTCCPEGAFVTLFTSDGRSFRRFNGAATGMPQKPMSDGDLERKFRDCAKTLLDAEEMDALLDRIRVVDTLATSSELSRSWARPR